MTEEDFRSLKESASGTDFDDCYAGFLVEYSPIYCKLVRSVLSNRLPTEEDVDDITMEVISNMQGIFKEALIIKGYTQKRIEKRIEIIIKERAKSRRADFYRKQNEKRGRYISCRILAPTTVEELAKSNGVEEDEIRNLNEPNKTRQRKKTKSRKREINCDKIKVGDRIKIPIKKISLDDVETAEAYQADPKERNPPTIVAEKELRELLENINYPCFILMRSKVIMKEKLSVFEESNEWRKILVKYHLAKKDIYKQYRDCRKLFKYALSEIGYDGRTDII